MDDSTRVIHFYVYFFAMDFMATEVAMDFMGAEVL